MTQISRRVFLRMTGIAAGATALAACAAPGGTGSTGGTTKAQVTQAVATTAAEATTAPTTGAAASGNVTTVEWWDSQTGVDQDVTNEMIKTFEGKNPDIKINRTYIAQDQNTQANDKLLTAIAGGTPPDVFKFDRFIVAQFAAQGFLTDLTEQANKDGVKAEDYWPFAWEEANYKGKVYALPYDTDTRALWYNKDLFTAAGLDPEKPPQTLQELQDISDKLQKTGGGGRITNWGYIPTSDQAWTYTYGFAFKGQFQDPSTKKITSANPNVVKSMQWLKDYATHVGVQNLDDFAAACAGNVCNDQNDYFWTGQTAMTCSGDWRVSQQLKYKPDGKYGVTPFPGPDGPAPDASWAGGWSWVVPKGAPHLDQAWQTVAWTCGPEGQDMFCKGTYHIPTNKKAAEDPYYRENPLHAAFMDLLPVSHTRPPIPAGSLLWDSLVASRDEIVHGKVEPEASLKAVDDKVNAELEKLGFLS